MATVLTSIKYSDTPSDSDLKSEGSAIPPLGEPFQDDRKFFWQKAKEHNLDATATQPSVYDDPILVEKYKPRSDWENLHRFNTLARWTWREERAVVKKIDWRIMVWTCIMFGGLEIDRANIGQAVSDNMLDDLGMTTNDLNLGATVFALSFLAAELPSQLVSKWAGPDRWIPAQLTLWSIVAISQSKLSGRTSFLATRALLGILQGGFIPDVILYLSYFYTHAEMSIRLGCFWIAMTGADIVAALLGAGLLRMRGVLDFEGWRWMFLVEGLITLIVGLCSFVLMPPSPTGTAGLLRGKKGWFNEREEEIMVNRVIRDDVTKGSMHNRQPITPYLLYKSILDYDLWPMYLIGVTFIVPVTTTRMYLTLSLRGLGFDVFETNLLTIPSQVLGMALMLLWVWLAEKYKQPLAWASLAQVWSLPFLIWLRVGYGVETSRWTTWALLTLLLATPMLQPLQVNLVSRNSNGVRLRTVSAALYNMTVQTAAIVASNIYRADDAPLYRRGNSVLLGIIAWNLVMYAFAKTYYVWKNKSRQKEWGAMTSEEQLVYMEKNQDRGNKRLDFRFMS